MSKRLRVLFVGNSYTYFGDMPNVTFKQTAEEAGYEVEITSITCGGYRLCQFADPENEHGIRLRKAISGVRYDFAVLQEQSLNPIKNEAEFLCGVRDVAALIDADRFILYATWGRNDNSPDLEALGLDRVEMTERLSAAYNKAAESIGATVAEVGMAFLSYAREHDKDELYAPDCSHPSPVGSNIAARTIFSEIERLQNSTILKRSGCYLHDFYTADDTRLAMKLEHIGFMPNHEYCPDGEGEPYVHVQDPGEELGYFLHEAAIIEYEGTLFASWYNCRKKELVGYTPIVGRRSHDGGKTWTSAETIAEDATGEILYCPPVYGICDGKLYMLLNQMVAPDHIHSLDLYVLDRDTDKFVRLWSRPIPFKLNTNVVELPDGRLILPGRVGELDGFPNTPAALISDSGKIDSEWRLVKVAEDGNLPDVSCYRHPETTIICADGVLYMFNRNDRRSVPIVYISRDMGESWSAPMAHDIPYMSSKIYGGALSDGRYYLIGNEKRSDRSKLVLYLSEKGSMRMQKHLLLINCEGNDEMSCCHYPAAVEADGKLHIIATANYKNGRGAVLFSVDITRV